jgi:DNA-binding transcriptional regulator YdaS (Cro superfamily)
MLTVMKNESSILEDLPATRRAVIHAGGATALARALGITPQAVSRWMHAEQIPAKWIIPIEALIRGAVTREELRPDLYPTASPTYKKSKQKK